MHSLRLSTLFTAPLLETVHMDFSNPDHIAQLLEILPIPCRQIRQLFCYSGKYQPAVLYGRLSLSKQTFPLLERCVIISSDTSTQSSDPISASRPVEGRVENDGVLHLVTSHADVLDAFSFPSLRALSIGNPDEKPENLCEISKMIFKHASDMLLASGCSLVSLVMSYTFTLVDEFLEILEVLPTLEILDMWWIGAARDEVLCTFFTALGNRTSGGTFSLLPALQDLRLSIKPPGWSFNDEWNYPADCHAFRFVSRVFGSIPERSRAPSEFRVLSLTMATDKASSWRLSEGDIDALLDLESTRFVLEGPRSDFMASEQW
ncbi:hypothetical protein CPB85DRAFT_1441576 [Mucidula mucida]|nr:hypothetical protein CPB85DRAFT_1441576 [Mucidula mucida]